MLPEVKALAERKEKLFRANPFNPILDTHRLHGRLRDFWAFSINSRYRIVFEFESKNLVYFLLIGDHSIYERL